MLVSLKYTKGNYYFFLFLANLKTNKEEYEKKKEYKNTIYQVEFELHT